MISIGAVGEGNSSYVSDITQAVVTRVEQGRRGRGVVCRLRSGGIRETVDAPRVMPPPASPTLERPGPVGRGRPVALISACGRTRHDQCDRFVQEPRPIAVLMRDEKVLVEGGIGSEPWTTGRWGIVQRVGQVEPDRIPPAPAGGRAEAGPDSCTPVFVATRGRLSFVLTPRGPLRMNQDCRPGSRRCSLPVRRGFLRLC